MLGTTYDILDDADTIARALIAEPVSATEMGTFAAARARWSWTRSRGLCRRDHGVLLDGGGTTHHASNNGKIWWWSLTVSTQLP